MSSSTMRKTGGEKMEELDLSKRYVYWFSEISKIPHGSRNEKALSDRIVRFAKENGLSWKQDEVYNVIIEKPASKGCENAAPLILQAHIDMVNEKTMDSPHDFEHDPLRLHVKDGWLCAENTTLGADDGKGVAYMLAILEDQTLVHPPLECIFTVMEEIGLVGAKHLKAEDIHASRMISLDGGGEHVTDTSSSAACRQVAERRCTRSAAEGSIYELTLSGLCGGHSAGMVAKGRGNAILMTARILYDAQRAGAGIRLCTWEGGSKNNAVPSYNHVVFCCRDEDAMKRSFEKTITAIREEYHVIEPDLNTVLEPAEAADAVSKEDTDAILGFLMIVPDGFMRSNPEIEGLTSLSSNTGVIAMNDESCTIQLMSRADRDSALDYLIDRIQLCAEACGLTHERGEIDPAWFYTPKSVMREIFGEVLRKHDDELVCNATHGGLECGVFKSLNPEMDIITFGANGQGEHSVKERLNLASFDRSYQLLLEIIAAAAEK